MAAAVATKILEDNWMIYTHPPRLSICCAEESVLASVFITETGVVELFVFIDWGCIGVT